eukprot:TRINITY_DN58461_c0_g1_i3.p2 TRINITY_DN58461_c0_g1~~TRINITY_DN58461_c0_g1_i3.p2  ORF type:complete len:140 (+),score=12.24 TRINITY_DN58461_c0_g1_i3:65-421(+)
MHNDVVVTVQEYAREIGLHVKSKGNDVEVSRQGETKRTSHIDPLPRTPRRVDTAEVEGSSPLKRNRGGHESSDDDQSSQPDAAAAMSPQQEDGTDDTDDADDRYFDTATEERESRFVR